MGFKILFFKGLILLKVGNLTLLTVGIVGIRKGPVLKAVWSSG